MEYMLMIQRGSTPLAGPDWGRLSEDGQKASYSTPTEGGASGRRLAELPS